MSHPEMKSSLHVLQSEVELLYEKKNKSPFDRKRLRELENQIEIILDFFREKSE